MNDVTKTDFLKCAINFCFVSSSGKKNSDFLNFSVDFAGLNFATSLVAMAPKDVILRPSFCHRVPNWRPSLKT